MSREISGTQKFAKLLVLYNCVKNSAQMQERRTKKFKTKVLKEDNYHQGVTEKDL